MLFEKIPTFFEQYIVGTIVSITVLTHKYARCTNQAYHIYYLMHASCMQDCYVIINSGGNLKEYPIIVLVGTE